MSDKTRCKTLKPRNRFKSRKIGRFAIYGYARIRCDPQAHASIMDQIEAIRRYAGTPQARASKPFPTKRPAIEMEMRNDRPRSG